MEWYIEDNFSIARNSMDADCRVTLYGLYVLEICKTYGVHMLNGRKSGDMNGEYTYMSSTGKSIVDYILISSSLFEQIIDFSVEDQNNSDHFPLKCILKCNITKYLIGEDENYTPFVRYKWKISEKEHFLKNLNDAETVTDLINLMHYLARV